MRAHADEQIVHQCGLALQKATLRLEALGVSAELEELLLLARVHRQARRDAVGDLARRRRRELVHDGAIAACVVGDRHDRDEILAERLDRGRGPFRGVVTLDLIQIAHAPDEVGRGVADGALDREATAATHDDVRTAIGEGRDREDLRLGPDRVRLCRPPDLGAGTDEHHAERTLAVDRAPHEEAVARLEDVERQQHLGKEHRAEREQRQRLRHARNGTLTARDEGATRGIDMIRLLLHGELRQWSPGGRKEMNIAAAGRTARDVLSQIGVPAAETAAFVVNGEQCEADVVLVEGDTLEVLPAISGGAAEGALEGVRVVDLSRALAGPYCTLMLGDQGADVIKVEMPVSGDEARDWAPPRIRGVSAYFLSINRNKRSLTLDLKHPDGKRVLERLIERGDVVVENFSPGTLAHLGFPDDRVRAINPRAILCHISGFGQDGPGRAWPAYDLIVQGMGGIMSLTGHPDGDPVMVGVPQADIVAGMFAAFAIATALHARTRTGEGQVIDATMIGGQVALLSRQASRYFADGTVPRPEGNMHASIAPYQTFRAADGSVNVCVANNALFERMCRALDLEELLEDRRFGDNPSRVAHRRELVPVIERRIATLAKAEVVRRLREANVPVGPINSLEEVFTDPVVRHLGLIAEVDHPTAGRVRAPGIPVRLSGTPASVRRHPPELGEHNTEILRELGYDDEEVAALRRDGAI